MVRNQVKKMVLFDIFMITITAGMQAFYFGPVKFRMFAQTLLNIIWQSPDPDIITIFTNFYFQVQP